MKIELSNKKTFIAIAVICALLIFGAAIAEYDPTKGSHSTLWTDRIEPKTAGGIVIGGDVQITGTLSMPATGAAGTTISPVTCDWNGAKEIEARFNRWGSSCSGCCGYDYCGYTNNECSYNIMETVSAVCSGNVITGLRQGERIGGCGCRSMCMSPGGGP